MSLTNWIYLPKPRSQLKRFRATASRSTGTGILQRKRRFNRDEHSRLFKLVVGLFLIVLSVRLGSIIALTLHHPLGFQAVMEADGVHLPQAETGQEIYAPRFLVLISITNEGIVEFSGVRKARDEWVPFLLDYRSMQPRTRALLLVDRNCTMDQVQEVLSALKEAGILEVLFATSSRNDVHL